MVIYIRVARTNPTEPDNFDFFVITTPPINGIVDIPFIKPRNVRHSGMFLAGIQSISWMPAKNMLA
jgi:hypothetical protein